MSTGIFTDDAPGRSLPLPGLNGAVPATIPTTAERGFPAQHTDRVPGGDRSQARDDRARSADARGVAAESVAKSPDDATRQSLGGVVAFGREPVIGADAPGDHRLRQSFGVSS